MTAALKVVSGYAFLFFPVSILSYAVICHPITCQYHPIPIRARMRGFFFTLVVAFPTVENREWTDGPRSLYRAHRTLIHSPSSDVHPLHILLNPQ